MIEIVLLVACYLLTFTIGYVLGKRTNELKEEVNDLRNKLIEKLTDVAVDVVASKEDVKSCNYKTDHLEVMLEKLEAKVTNHNALLNEMSSEYTEYVKAAAKAEQDWDEGLKSILNFSINTAKENS